MDERRWQRRVRKTGRARFAKPRWKSAEKASPPRSLTTLLNVRGVRKGTLHLYFADKAELFRAVVRDAIAPISNMQVPWHSLTAPFPEVVRWLARPFR
jgi:AcrR family transcriptional regulator